MEIGYYPGCSLESSAKEFDFSIRAILKNLGISLKEIPDWNCCGASPAHYFSEELALALPYRNLIQAEEAGLETILSPCPACYSHLTHLHKLIGRDSALHHRLTSIVGKEYHQRLISRHILDFIKEEVGLERLREKVEVPLKGLQIVSYYGCLTRLPGVGFDDVENPMIMDEIIEALGGEPIDWSFKTECCGASLSVSKTEIALRLMKGILEGATEKKADCIAVVCPLCQSNLDSRQNDINKNYGTSYKIPVIYLTQLIGLTQKVNPSQLGLNRLIIQPLKFYNKKG